jgi:hypothetical protein
VICEVTNVSILSTTDVDTDLYKLIMSPQYLTTEHIQVSRFAECDSLTSCNAPNTHITYSYYIDVSVSNGGWFELYSFVFCDSSRFGKQCRLLPN